MTSATKCIYCSNVIDPSRGEGDHVIPAALGRFRDDLRFRRLCRLCNGELGRLEETLLRSAPEAFFRRIVQPKVKRNRRGKSWVAAQGGACPKFLRKHSDHTEIVEPSTEDPRNVTPIDQLVIIDEEKREHHIRLFRSMTAEHLQGILNSLGLSKPSERTFLHADDANWEHYTGILNTVWQGSSVVETAADDSGMHRVPGRTEFRFSTDYWRALAKIAFHYYLVVTRRGFHGDEDQFADIRRFIKEGGDQASFFEGRGARFLTPFRRLPTGGAIVPPCWVHLLAADEEQLTAVASVSLFVGPQRLPSSHQVTLCQFGNRLVIPQAQMAHAYIYDTQKTDQRFTGSVKEITVSRIR